MTNLNSLSKPSTADATVSTRATLRRRQLVVQVLLYALLIVLTITFLLPFFWMVTSSLKLDSQVYRIPIEWIPNPVWLENYPNGLTYLPFGTYFLNTIKYCVLSVIGAVLASSFVAYGFSRVQWPGRDKVFVLVLATMMLPFQVQMIPLYLIFNKIGWLNTYLPLVVPQFLAPAFFIFLLRQFFRSIPTELSDAARIDGANEIRILFSIILPLAKPALAVVALYQFIDSWNDYLGPLIYINDAAQYPLAMGLKQMQSILSSVGTIPQQWPQLMAVSTVVTIPIIIVYLFTQRFFVEGITLTGING